jgi:hypothetical protein
MAQEKPKRVKILNASYNDVTNIVKWEIRDIKEKRELTLAWNSNDLGQALGIEQMIPPEAMSKFCEDMVGKEINLIMHSEDMPVNAFNITEAGENEFGDFNNKFSPYQDIIGKVLEEDEGGTEKNKD